MDVQIPGRIAAKACGAMAEDTAVLVRLMERDVQIPGRIAAKTCGAMAEDTAVLVMEVVICVR